MFKKLFLYGEKMKKLLTILSLIFALSLFGACHQHSFSAEWSKDASHHWHASTCHNEQKSDFALHSLVESGETDADGNPILVCSVCGFTHQHLYDADKWEYNGREHWHPVICAHTDAPIFAEEHDFDDDTGVCTVCGCDQEKANGYEVAFAYYQVDENGEPIIDSSGSYSQVGVTYTSVEENGSVMVDTVNGAILYDGDKISFTVEKSVFCYYTDKAESPLVEIISGSGQGQNTVETVYPDENGVYTVEIKGDTIVSVANVATSPRTIQGKGTQEEPFTINSVVDWLYFAMYVNDKSYYSLEYNIGYWKLNVDLDFEGESIYVIGDGYSSQNSVFCGNFDGNGHTISNFVLENSGSSAIGAGYSNYLGLFGVVTGYVGVDSVIANLTVENVTVNATAGNNDIVTAGCILGYGVGANIRNCTVRNAQINVIADDTYMSFAGGVVGFLQSGMTDDGMLFYSSVAYSVAENITIKGTGMLYGAGGIAGRVVSYSDQVTAFVINSYSSGSISDAVRTGGIVGELQRYGALQNCYSTASVSSYSTIKAEVEQKFNGTVLDDRYSYAGGIVGYAENDTVVEGCFFAGSTYSTALAGKSFAKQDNIVAGYSSAGYADYYAERVILNNQADGDTVTNEYLKNNLGWSVADWSFGDGYPTINQQEASNEFTVTISIGGEQATCQINSQYIPLSYWYILSANPSITQQTIARYYSHGTNRTYGYYFDQDLTVSVPVGYVPMKDITLYARYVDTSAITGEYFISNNGVSATLNINGNGTYIYEEGAIVLNGEYKFDGEIVTFERSIFSRLASTATSAQKASYYTFWAEVLSDRNLNLFDCDDIYIVSAENEEQNSTFTTMARFYSKDNPLEIIHSDNLSFTGGYFYTDAGVKHVFEFNNDFTGGYKKYAGEEVVTDTFSFYVDDEQGLIISLDKNGARFIVSVDQDGVPVSIVDNRDKSFALSAIDGFVGVWEKQATTHKIYTFDGMGKWSYEHYVYLVEENLVNATKHVVSQSSGTYAPAGENQITFIRDGINVVATLVDGVIYITEDGQPVQVEFTNQNGFKGVWYTANNKIIRYTLTLDGLNANGVGSATLDGFEIEPLELRYTAVSNDTLYLYVENIVYAILQYSAKTGLFEGMFYDTATGSTTTPQTLYLYDDFAGAWVSDIEAISTIKFNGFGNYNTTDKTGNSLAVKGLVTIGNDTVEYTVDRQTEKAQFTYKDIVYTLSYNEYKNEISVSYGGKDGVIAKADEFVDIVLKATDGKYEFDGRGKLTSGGTVTFNGEKGSYKIQGDSVEMDFAGQVKTILIEKQNGAVAGYSLNGDKLYIDNPFSGVWAVSGEYISITVGEIACMPQKGQTIKIIGEYSFLNNKGEPTTVNEVDMYFDGVDTVSFEIDGKRYGLISTLGMEAPALIYTETIIKNNEIVIEAIAVKQDNFFGTWSNVEKPERTLTFDGAGDTAYVASGKVYEWQGQNKRVWYTYKMVDGAITIYDTITGEIKYTFIECNQGDEGAYVYGDRYYRLNDNF